MNEQPKCYMVFDVESIGLHGDGFAVAWCVLDKNGREIDAGCLSCNPEVASGDSDDREWVSKNVPPLVRTHETLPAMRTHFWSEWLKWKGYGAVLVADCCWPVESRFLAACINDSPRVRKWEGPYPLHDLASMFLMAGMDPTGSHWEESDGRRHDPLNDARQSARMLRQVLLAHPRAAGNDLTV